MATQPLRITELDFISIRDNLKAYLKSQAEFTDYDFEGSAMAVLLDILAYNTHYMAMQLNLVGNEMFIDTAQLRSSVVSLAKLSNYVPTSTKAATAKVNILVTPSGSEDNTAPMITLDRYTRFLSDPINGVSYSFLSVNANNAIQANGSYAFSNVVIKQGEHLTSTFLVDQNNPRARFTIDNEAIDVSTLRVSVQDSEANTALTTYVKANDITTLTGNSTVYFVEENAIDTGNYTLYFGDGIIGKALSNGNIVIADYITARGSVANRAKGFTAINGVAGYTGNVIVTTVDSSYGGAEKESIESIRYRAPIARTAQNRTVVDSDYTTLIPKLFPGIDAVSVWGGADNMPPVYGKVFIAVKPSANYVLSLTEKEEIKSSIIKNTSVLTVFPEIVDPEYTYLLIKAKVYFDQSATTLDKEELKALVRAAVLDYKETELKLFNSTFRKSRLQKYIDDAHSSITGSNIEVYLQKRFEPELFVNQSIAINFNTPLYKSGSTNKLFTYPEVIVKDFEGIDRRVLIEEVPDSFTGIDNIIITNVGTGYSTTPTVTITGDGTGAEAEAVIVNGKLNSINVVNKGSNYSRAIVTITGGGGTGGTAIAELQAKNGVLRTYYYKTTGEKIIVDSSMGTIDYADGSVVLTNFEPNSIIDNTRYDTNVVTINIQPEEGTVSTVRNSIIDIDEYDASSIVIDMVAE